MKRNKVFEIAQRSLREGRLEGIIDVPKSGRWGDWVYYMRGGKQCCRRYVKPRDPRTPAQLRCRATLSAASRAWSDNGTITEPEREACRREAKRRKTRRRLGQRGKQTGQLYYVGRQCTITQSPRNGTEVEGAAGSKDGRGCRGEEARPSRCGVKAGPSPQAAVRAGARSTWEQYRSGSVAIPLHYRCGTRAGRQDMRCLRRAGAGQGLRRRRRPRELWRGG